MTKVHIEVESPVTQVGLETLLREQAEIEVVSCDTEADVSVRDVFSAEAAGLVVLLTDELSARDALRAGARAALPSAATPAQIVAAIHAAAAGLAAIPAVDMALLVPVAEVAPAAEP